MKFGVTGNLRKQGLWKAVYDLLLSFQSRNVGYVLEKDLAAELLGKYQESRLNITEVAPSDDLPGRCNMIFAFGGDGTILRTARLAGPAGIPVVGVNLGKLGFLAEFAVDDIPALIDRILRQDYTIEDRMVLCGKVQAPDQPHFFGFNDIVIDKWAYSRIIHIETYVDGEYVVTYNADGLILSTPTGSTGYSLSAQGPIVAPNAKMILINPLSPHSLTARPLIVADTSIIKVVIYSEAEKVHVVADGQVNAEFKPPLEMTVQRAAFDVRLIRKTEQAFFDVLRSKLMWGRDIRGEKRGR